MWTAKCLLTLTVSMLFSNFPFCWQPKVLKYLGIFLPTDLKTLIAHNYDPLLPTVLELLDSYDKPTLSWLRRINVIKIDFLTKLLYIFHTILFPTLPLFPASVLNHTQIHMAK